MDHRMEIFMFTALIGGLAVACKLIPEILVELIDLAQRIRENGVRGHRLTPVPAHTVRRLSRQRHRR